MSNFIFTKAVKYGSKLRMALIGTSGSGKTYSALSIATHLGKRVAFIDTEHGSARKYSDVFDFDVIEFDSYAVENFLSAIKAAEQAGYDVLVIDSLSHAWSGKDGLLEFVDQQKAKSRTGNAFTDGWRQATPLHNKLIDAILASPLHVIVCMRSKTEYVMQEDSRGKKVPTKIGMQPVQREGMEYEFDVIGDMDMEHNLIVGKTRCRAIDGKIYPKPGSELASILVEWLGGVDAPLDMASNRVATPVQATPSPASAQQYKQAETVTAPQVPPLLAQAREACSKALKSLNEQKLGGFGDMAFCKASVKDNLHVDNVALCTDIEALRDYTASLKSVINSDTPFDNHLTQVVATTPAAMPSNTPPDPVDDLVLQLSQEMDRRDVPGGMIKFFGDELTKHGDARSISGLETTLAAIRSYKLKPAPVDEAVANLWTEIEVRHQGMANYEIDNFHVSSRLSNSVNEHLGKKKVRDCTDPVKLAAYVIHLQAIIDNAMTESGTKCELVYPTKRKAS